MTSEEEEDSYSSGGASSDFEDEVSPPAALEALTAASEEDKGDSEKQAAELSAKMVALREVASSLRQRLDTATRAELSKLEEIASLQEELEEAKQTAFDAKQDADYYKESSEGSESDDEDEVKEEVEELRLERSEMQAEIRALSAKVEELMAGTRAGDSALAVSKLKAEVARLRGIVGSQQAASPTIAGASLRGRISSYATSGTNETTGSLSGPGSISDDVPLSVSPSLSVRGETNVTTAPAGVPDSDAVDSEAATVSPSLDVDALLLINKALGLTGRRDSVSSLANAVNAVADVRERLMSSNTRAFELQARVVELEGALGNDAFEEEADLDESTSSGADEDELPPPESERSHEGVMEPVAPARMHKRSRSMSDMNARRVAPRQQSGSQAGRSGSAVADAIKMRRQNSAKRGLGGYVSRVNETPAPYSPPRRGSMSSGDTHTGACRR